MILTGAEIDTLIAIVERGPLQDDGVPSKTGRNGLLSLGLIAEVVINMDYWFYAASPKGLEWYLDRYKANNIRDARYHRIIVRQMP